MKIAAHLGVKDEIGLIAPCLDHLHRIGIDEIIVCDMMSTDGTAEFLSARASSRLRVVTCSNADSNDSWMEANMSAIRESDADWIVFLDADEFPLPRTGNLAGALAGETRGVIQVPRYNVPVGPDGILFPVAPGPADYGSVQLIVKPVTDFRARLQSDPEMPWIRMVPLPKVIARRHLIARLADGCHDIVPPLGTVLAGGVAKDVITAHLPVTSFERFERKIANCREVLTHHSVPMGPGFAWHWTRWVELADRGQLRTEYARTVFSHEQLRALADDGTIRTAASMFEAPA